MIGLLESERAEMREQPGTSGPAPVLHRRQLDGAGWIALEQLSVMRLHDIEVAEQIASECRFGRHSRRKRAKRSTALDFGRQAVGLPRSAIICKRCSTRRRNSYAAVNSSRAA